MPSRTSLHASVSRSSSPANTTSTSACSGSSSIRGEWTPRTTETSTPIVIMESTPTENTVRRCQRRERVDPSADFTPSVSPRPRGSVEAQRLRSAVRARSDRAAGRSREIVGRPAASDGSAAARFGRIPSAAALPAVSQRPRILCRRLVTGRAAEDPIETVSEVATPSAETSTDVAPASTAPTATTIEFADSTTPADGLLTVPSSPSVDRCVVANSGVAVGAWLSLRGGGPLLGSRGGWGRSSPAPAVAAFVGVHLPVRVRGEVCDTR